MVEKVCLSCGEHFRAKTRAVTCSEECKKEKLARDSRLFRSKNPLIYKDADNRRSKKNHYKNRDYILKRKAKYNISKPESHVRCMLKKQLGFEPTADLVEEATAMRLLNREIKKAGE